MLTMQLYWIIRYSSLALMVLLTRCFLPTFCQIIVTYCLKEFIIDFNYRKNCFQRSRSIFSRLWRDTLFTHYIKWYHWCMGDGNNVKYYFRAAIRKNNCFSNIFIWRSFTCYYRYHKQWRIWHGMYLFSIISDIRHSNIDANRTQQHIPVRM